jgi:hypothetical protein
MASKGKGLYVKMPYSKTRLLTMDTVRMLLIFLNSIIVYAVNHGDSDSLFAIGQTLRIRIGPLKGYLCRVTGIRRSDVTVKLDSQQKFLTGMFMVVLHLILQISDHHHF